MEQLIDTPEYRGQTERMAMVLNSKQTTVAYRCPACGVGVMSAVGLFSLSADMVKLKCTCKQSEMQVIYDKQNSQVRLTVPCLFCDKPHNFTLNSTLFFSKDLFVTPCPYSGINIGFIGESEHVKAELARTELELMDLLEQNGIDSFSKLHGEENCFTDPQIFDIVMYVIKDLDAEGKIYCKCHPNGREPLPDGCDAQREDCMYDAEITDEGIKITCRECGASKVISTDSNLSAHAFLNSDFISLE